MKKKYDHVYQFKITLEGIRPPIWRKIQVPETYTFWDMHVAIQDSMGWMDYHLHEFAIPHPSRGSIVKIGMPDNEFGGNVLEDWNQKITRYFSLKNHTAEYIYDFGDSWVHRIKLEKILPKDDTINYPICVKGKRAAPPEDCGGIWGYMNLLEIIKNPDHDEYEDTMEWLDEEFDPEYFDPEEVNFDDPSKRLKMAFEPESI